MPRDLVEEVVACSIVGAEEQRGGRDSGSGSRGIGARLRGWLVGRGQDRRQQVTLIYRLSIGQDLTCSPIYKARLYQHYRLR